MIFHCFTALTKLNSYTELEERVDGVGVLSLGIGSVHLLLSFLHSAIFSLCFGIGDSIGPVVGETTSTHNF